MKLAMIGTGYVGLVAGAGFSDFGNDVTCVDVDEARIAALSRGEVPIHEPKLQELVQHNAQAGRLRFSTSIGEAMQGADVVFIAVGTPPAEDGGADLSQVLSAAEEIARAITRPAVVVIKSTVPPGTNEQVEMAIACVRYSCAVASNPEFLKEGAAVDDFMYPDRVIVGVGRPGERTSGQQHAVDVLRRLYGPLVRTNDRVLVMDARSAEMTKYAANAYLATRVSFMNDIANLCERAGADVEMVRRGMGMDTRIGPKFLFPGIGFGGSCFPKDVRALLRIGRSHGIELPIVAAAHQINEHQKTVLFNKILQHLRPLPAAAMVEFGGGAPCRITPLGLLHGKTIAIWGLAFKPETDDVREAPALPLIERLLRADALVRVSDPAARADAQIRDLCAEVAPNGSAPPLPVSMHADPYEAARGADALVLCTEWRQYRQPDWKRLREIMVGDGVFDGRNVWDPGQVREAGFAYYGIGRT